MLENLKQCNKCPELVKSRQLYEYPYPVMPEDPGEPHVICVGQCPGMYGAGRTGKVFYGDASGKLFRKVVNAYPEIRFYITNTVKCTPYRNRVPTKTEIENCLPYLEAELNLYKSLPIIALGGVALRACVKCGAAERLSHIPHPAYAIRTGCEQAWADMFSETLIQLGLTKKLQRVVV